MLSQDVKIGSAVRLDGKIYFGEMTFYHWSGMVPFEPEEWDKTFGDWIELPRGE